jgi:hypothetical protein
MEKHRFEIVHRGQLANMQRDVRLERRRIELARKAVDHAAQARMIRTRRHKPNRDRS